MFGLSLLAALSCYWIDPDEHCERLGVSGLGDCAPSPGGGDDSGGADPDTERPGEDTDCPDPLTWHLDADGDTWGDDATTDEGCAPPGEDPPWVTRGGDCDDGNAGAYPGAEEVWYDGADQDCAGGDDFDADGDGDACRDEHPDCAGEDCDDGDDAVHPAAEETWYDGVDQDCDGASDYDADADGYDSEAEADGEDCDDGEGAVNPSAEEDCETAIDEDCDGAAGCGLPPELTWAEDSAARIGLSPGTAGGLRSAWAGDVNGDGAPDFLINADQLDDGGEDAGGAYLVYGPIGGELILPDDADVTFVGAAAGERAGYPRLGPAGDIDGDGYGDLLIASTSAEDYGYLPNGAIYLVFGAEKLTGSQSLSIHTAITGNEGYFLGNSACGLGDVDGDTIDDFAVAMSKPDDAYHGRSYLFLGRKGLGSGHLSSADASILGAASEDRAAFVVSAGDVDGDGLRDFLIGAPEESTTASDAGSVYLVLGRDKGGWPTSVTGADAVYRGARQSDYLGGWTNPNLQTMQRSPGDANSDGYDDLLLGTPHHDPDPKTSTSPGAAWLVYRNSEKHPIPEQTLSPDLGARLDGAAENDQAGQAVSFAGDLDGDGHDDLAISALEIGVTYVVYGPVEGTYILGGDGDVQIDGGETGDITSGWGGFLVEGPGDVDGDGRDDLLFGALGAETWAGGEVEGAVSLIPGVP